MEFRPYGWNRILCVSLGLCFVLTGCGAHFNSIHRTSPLKSEEILISQDAKQRVITRLRHPHNSKVITCIEPPPDVFSVLAAAASGTFSSPQGVAAALSGASSETGASIGLRTQSIQLLRDQSYRICESYANGALDELDYAQLMRRNQVMLTAVLAIEQLTGAVVGPAAAIGATSSVEVDKEAVQKASDKVGEVQKEIGTQQGAVDAAQKAVDDQNAVIAPKQKAVQDQQGVVDEKTRAVAEATAELEKHPDANSAEHIAAKAALDAANAELKTATDKLTAARAELTAEQTKIKGLEEGLTKQKGTLKGLEDQLTVAMRALNAAQAPNLSTGTASTLQGPAVVSKDIRLLPGRFRTSSEWLSRSSTFSISVRCTGVV